MRLLVSVVNEEEVTAAVEGGADIVDVKNPSEGTLGGNFPHVIRRVRKHTPPALEVSATIGDVPNLPGTVSLAALGASVCGVQYIKVGLFGIHNPPEAVLLLRQVCRAAREHHGGIQIIAAAYADADKVKALHPCHLPAIAKEAGVNGCLLDTALKGDGTLLTKLRDVQLQEFVNQCLKANLLCALAGSLSLKDIPHVCKFGADIIGVRTAVCHGNRVNGRVDRQKVQRWKEEIALNESP